MFTVRPLGFPVFTVCVSMFTMCCSPWNLVFPSSSNVHCEFQCSPWNQCSLRVSVILVFIVFIFNPDIINREHSQGCSNLLFTVLSWRQSLGAEISCSQLRRDDRLEERDLGLLHLLVDDDVVTDQPGRDVLEAAVLEATRVVVDDVRVVVLGRHLVVDRVVSVCQIGLGCWKRKEYQNMEWNNKPNYKNIEPYLRIQTRSLEV